jgi:hypothetical protein
MGWDEERVGIGCGMGDVGGIGGSTSNDTYLTFDCILSSNEETV